MVKNMAIFHNTDTIILCGLDILDLTGKQNWAASIFSHQAFNNLIQAVALPWGNLLKKLSGRNSVILSFWLSCGLFFLPPLTSHLSICSSAFFLSLFLFLPNTCTASLHSCFIFFSLHLPFSLARLTLLPLIWTTPQGCSSQMWLRAGHSLLFLFSCRDCV